MCGPRLPARPPRVATVTATFEALVASWPDSRTTFCRDDAGEVACPAGTVGQDGHYEVQVPTYTVIGERVHDSVTDHVVIFISVA